MSQIESNEYQEAMKRALARKPFLHSDGKYLTREEIHDRDRSRAEQEELNRSRQGGAEAAER
ncbi:MAG: hypothetical protein WB622_17725 [Acidobacteriaceae bacterium]|jgi:hypothetical protein